MSETVEFWRDDVEDLNDYIQFQFTSGAWFGAGGATFLYWWLGNDPIVVVAAVLSLGALFFALYSRRKYSAVVEFLDSGGGSE